jgi:hypothetical protein
MSTRNLPGGKGQPARVPTRNVRDFLTFSVCPSNKHRPSARCVYTANVVGKDLDIFSIRAAPLVIFYNLLPKTVNNICSCGM